ncbi:secreted frizzled-related protein 5-like [Scleropages formosus]|uniref:Secreted frizzled-related protein 1 n=1 Tax=Scleropages formosus TaxID=113540 RepID=A0A0P7V5T6_SCLFO|nr:secreted frizzled-related protein 5 [Scleropages formosus]KPP68536.1 secreted frizzled-related protein 5-like [Scleropages formosus]
MARQGSRGGPVGPGHAAAAASMALGLFLLTWAASAEEYDYYSWQSDNFHTGGRFYARRPQCVDIPADLRLCHGVGYKRMRLPNLLEHETMPEVQQQAGSWVPLLAKRCHGDTQVFLCSLFAPICLDRPIYPCRSLCEAVRDSCAPVMESYGFPWPDMLRCDKFPIDNDLCIPMQFAGNPATQTPVSKPCPPCDNELKADAIMEHFCASDFALKMKIKEVKKEKGDRKLIAAQKKKKVLKTGALRKRDLKKLVLYIKNGAECPCAQLDNLAGSYLIMGRRVDQQLLLMAIHKWDKRSRELRFAVKQMKSHQCPTYHSVFQ